MKARNGRTLARNVVLAAVLLSVTLPLAGCPEAERAAKEAKERENGSSDSSGSY